MDSPGLLISLIILFDFHTENNIFKYISTKIIWGCEVLPNSPNPNYVYEYRYNMQLHTLNGVFLPK